jgi:nicotinamide mononucleotide transporter
MSLIEIIAVVFSLLCVFLAIKKNVFNWPIGIIAVTAYFILFYKVKLYADMTLQLIFLIQGFYGWYNWKRKSSESQLEIRKLTQKQIITYACSICTLTILWAYILKRYTDASLPFIDAFVTVISLTANWLLVKKYIENWLFWILANSIYIFLFLYKDLYLSSGIYLVFLVLAIKGYIDWKKTKDIEKDLF